MRTEPTTFRVPVDGGDLAVWRWGGGGPVVLAVHGVTASHRAWAAIADAVAGELTVVAPDLRGRGDSAAVAGAGLEGHVRDLAAILDHLEVRDAVVAGHSMGGWIAALSAVAFPDRTRAVVMVDGGPPRSEPLPADADTDAELARTVGPALDRLRQRFATRDAYREFWHSHPAFRNSGVDPDLIDAYADHDLHGPDGALRSKVDAGAVRADARDLLVDDAVHHAVAHLEVPAVLLVAERGMLDGGTPFYEPHMVDGVATAEGPLEVIRVAGTNHYTIAMGDVGAGAVAAQLRRFAEVG